MSLSVMVLELCVQGNSKAFGGEAEDLIPSVMETSWPMGSLLTPVVTCEYSHNSGGSWSRCGAQVHRTAAGWA